MIRHVFLGIVGILVLAQSAFAQAVPKTSQLVGVGLEVSGYAMQAMVVDELGDMLIALGALVFIALAIYGVYVLAVFKEPSRFYEGGYMKAILYLIGPALFIYCVFTRTETIGVPRENQPVSVEEASQAFGRDVRVSTVFHVWNTLVTRTFDSLAGLISEEGKPEEQKLKNQLSFMIRQQLVEQLHETRIGDPGLNALLQSGLRGSCGRMMQASRVLALGARDELFAGTPAYNQALRLYECEYQGKCDGDFKPVYHELSDGLAKDYLRELLTFYQDWFHLHTMSLQNQVGKLMCPSPEFLEEAIEHPAATVDNPMSCRAIWCFSMLGLVTSAELAVGDYNRLVMSRMDEDYQITDDERQALRAIWRDIAASMVELPDRLVIRDAETGDRLDFDQLREQIAERDTFYEDNPEALDTLMEHLREAWEAGFRLDEERIEATPDIIPMILAGRLLRHALSDRTSETFLTQFAEHADVRVQNFDWAPGNMNRNDIQEATQRFQRAGLATEKRFELFTFAMALPMFQGTMLYYLAVSFPFFALLLLVPGKMESFLLWFSFWAWVKSWNVGWAVVSVVDSILWHLMPKSAEYNPFIDPRHAPVDILESAFNGDPAYNLATYYTIISVLLVAVPIVSAQILLGSKSIFGQLLLAGWTEVAENLSKTASNWKLHNSIQRVDIQREGLAAGYAALKMGTPANDKMEEAWNEAKRMMERGEGMRSWGGRNRVAGTGMVVLGGLGTVAGVALSFTGVGAIVGVPLAAGSAGLAYGGVDTHSKALTLGGELQSRAHQLYRDYYVGNAQANYYQAGKVDSVRDLDAVRGGLSGRGEYWNIPDSANIIAATSFMKQNLENIQAQEKEIRSAYNWNLGTNIVLGGVGFVPVAGQLARGGQVGVRVAGSIAAREGLRQGINQTGRRAMLRTFGRHGMGRAIVLNGLGQVALRGIGSAVVPTVGGWVAGAVLSKTANTYGPEIRQFTGSTLDNIYDTFSGEGEAKQNKRLGN